MKTFSLYFATAIFLVATFFVAPVASQPITEEELQNWSDTHCVPSGVGDYQVGTYVDEDALPMLRLSTSSPNSAAAFACVGSSEATLISFQYQATLLNNATARFRVFPAVPGCVEEVDLPPTSGWEEHELIVSCDSINVVNFVLLHSSQSGSNEWIMNLSSLEEIWSIFEGILVVANEGDPTELPNSIQLLQAYPNPFNPSTIIPFELNEGSDVRIAVYDMLGRKVATLVDGIVAAGRHEVRFDAEGLPSGVYFYQLRAESTARHGRVTLVK